MYLWLRDQVKLKVITAVLDLRVMPAFPVLLRVYPFLLTGFTGFALFSFSLPLTHFRKQKQIEQVLYFNLGGSLSTKAKMHLCSLNQKRLDRLLRTKARKFELLSKF